MKNKQGYIYIVTNYTHSVVYIGVTSNLTARIFQHKHKVAEGFTNKYNVNHFVYYEVYDNIVDAIAREKYLKGKTRKYKNELINKFNPEWKDLYEDII